MSLAPVIVRTCRTRAVITGLIATGVAATLLVRMVLGLTTGMGWILEPLGAAFLTGCAFYLFAIAMFRPIALRMDADGISGYYAPPLRWEDIDSFDVYTERHEGGPFYTRHIGIKVARTTSLFNGLTRQKYDRALHLYKRTGFHILIPQMILKDLDANAVVYHAYMFQSAAQQKHQHKNTPNSPAEPDAPFARKALP